MEGFEDGPKVSQWKSEVATARLWFTSHCLATPVLNLATGSQASDKSCIIPHRLLKIVLCVGQMVSKFACS